MLLAGDVGGTKTELAIVSGQMGPRSPLVEETFSSADYPNLDALVGDFLMQADVRVERAVFGVAGPVIAGQATITNLPWVVEEAQLEKDLGISEVHLLNDLTATAYAVPYLDPEDLHTLSSGEPDQQGAIAIVAPGTGLGQAFLTWDGTRYRAYSSEGGHTDFAPSTPQQLELLRYLLEHFDHVSWERVCSGRGLPHIYAFLKGSGYAEEPSWLTERLARDSDPTPVIIDAALAAEPTASICVAAVEMFVSLLGAEAGNLALKVLATGGVYLAGGIPSRILPFLKTSSFLESFRSKGRMSNLLERIPVHVILNPKTALLGAACFGLNVAVQ